MTSTPPTMSSSASPPDAVAPDEPRRPGRPRDARAAGAILEAAVTELATSGYAGLSMDKVAARAGVSKATIYRRWPSREELILDAWRCIDPHKDMGFDTGSLRGDLELLLEQYRSELGSASMLALLPQVVAAVHQNPRLNELFTAFVDEQMGPFVELYARAKRRGELRPGVEPEVAAQLLTGLIFSRLLLRSELLPADELRGAIDIVLDGMLVDP